MTNWRSSQDISEFKEISLQVTQPRLHISNQNNQFKGFSIIGTARKLKDTSKFKTLVTDLTISECALTIAKQNLNTNWLNIFLNMIKITEKDNFQE